MRLPQNDTKGRCPTTTRRSGSIRGRVSLIPRVCPVTYNVLSAVKAALRFVHGEAASDAKVSGYDLAEEVAGTYRGMMIVVPKDEWVVFQGMSPHELCPFLKRLAGAVRLAEFRKQPRGPKKPRPRRQSRAEIKHVATAKLLEEQKAKPRKRKE
jgi:hypothetical protein